ncbi:hypothetical protein Tco_0139953 [Tanacetum coccineum]
MVARQPTTKEGGQKKTASKADKPKKATPVKKPAPAKQMKPVKEKSTKPAPSMKARKGKVLKVRKGKRSDRLVDKEDEEPQPAPEPQIEDDEYNIQRGIQMSLESFQAPVDGLAIREPNSGVTRSLLVVDEKGKAIATDKQAAQLLLELHRPKKKNAETGAETNNSNSKGDTEILNVDEEQGDNVSNIVALEERTVKLDEGQAGSNPGNTLESRPPPVED